MKPRLKIAAALVAIALALPILSSGCLPTNNSSRLGVVASTSQIAQIAKRVGGSEIEVANIIPPGQCPGHFDVKPNDIQKLAEGKLFFLHSWQGEKFSEGLIATADNPDLKIAILEIWGNWMTPAVQLEATDIITAELVQVDTSNGDTYQQRATEYKEIVVAKEAALKEELAPANLSQISVICAEKQAGFVKWLGFNLAGTFGDPESFTPQTMMELIDTSRAAGVTLLIDNLQSGHDAGQSIAEELDCPRIVLSNFPGGFPDTDTWEQAIDHNVRLVLEAISQ